MNFLSIKEYYDRLKATKEKNLHVIHPEIPEIIKIEIHDENISENILSPLGDSQFQVQIYDRELERKQIRSLDRKYKLALIRRGPVAGSNLWVITIAQFYGWAKYIITYELGKWILGHVTQDIDDELWNKVKNFIKKSFAQLIKSKKKENRKTAIVINVDYNPFKCIVFIFDSNFTAEQLEDRLNKIPSIIRGIDMNTKGPHIFESDLTTSEWQDAKDKYPMG